MTSPPPPDRLFEVIERTLDDATRGDHATALRRLIDAIRPRRADDADEHVVALCETLEHAGDGVSRALGAAVVAAVEHVRCVLALTESGIPFDHGFFEELSSRLARRVLPDEPDDHDLRGLVRHVFHRRDDHLWLVAVPEATWRRLMDLLGLHAETVVGVPDELAASIRVLAHHVASLGLSSEITERMPQLDGLDSPFLAVSDAVLRYTRSFDNDIEGDEEPLLDEALVTLADCRRAVEELRANKHVFGTSLRLTTLSFRLLRQVERLERLLQMTQPRHRDVQRAMLDVFLDVVRAECTRDLVRPHVRESADLLAYQVVEHAAKKGAKYITTTRAEYLKFLRSSLLGGAIVAVFALFKLELDALSLSLAAEAFVFSANYALCFVLIYVAGATLATKQPAMTANALARSMDGPRGEHRLDTLADMIVRVWRSQFISFVGNLLCAFPLAIVLAELHGAIAGSPLVTTETSAYLFAGVHPWASPALFYAGIAGVFLFLAGLTSGYFDNRNRYRRLSARIARVPWLRRVVGPVRAARIGTLVDDHGGAIVGNVFLGACLGTAGTLGVIFGVPFDIRHIAFSSANVGFGLDGVGYAVDPNALATAILGVLGIGFVNFVVSFGLALRTAMASRAIAAWEYRHVLRLVGHHLLRRPWDFFVPPSGASTPADAVPER